MEEKLLTVKQAAEILEINPKTLYQWRWFRKHLPFVKVGKSLRVSEKDLMEFIEKRREMPANL